VLGRQHGFQLLHLEDLLLFFNLVHRLVELLHIRDGPLPVGRSHGVLHLGLQPIEINVNELSAVFFFELLDPILIGIIRLSISVLEIDSGLLLSNFVLGKLLGKDALRGCFSRRVERARLGHLLLRPLIHRVAQLSHLVGSTAQLSLDLLLDNLES